MEKTGNAGTTNNRPGCIVHHIVLSVQSQKRTRRRFRVWHKTATALMLVPPLRDQSPSMLAPAVTSWKDHQYKLLNMFQQKISFGVDVSNMPYEANSAIYAQDCET